MVRRTLFSTVDHGQVLAQYQHIKTEKLLTCSSVRSVQKEFIVN